MWSKACQLLVAISSAKVSWLKHDLHSLKKGLLSTNEYLAKIKGICDIFEVFGYPVYIEEQVDIVLASLSVKFDSVLTLASFLMEHLKMDRLVNIILECEQRQKRFVLKGSGKHGSTLTCIKCSGDGFSVSSHD